MIDMVPEQNQVEVKALGSDGPSDRTVKADGSLYERKALYAPNVSRGSGVSSSTCLSEREARRQDAGREDAE